MKRRYLSLADYLHRGPETQEALAARLGVSQPAISRAANYGHGSFKLLKRIADATGVPLDSFDRREAA
jgi:transcriptional regulator with XRE-family HTH domain